MAYPTLPWHTAHTLFGPSCELLPNAAECEAELGISLLEPSDLPIGSEVAGPDIELPEQVAGALAEGGVWLELDPDSWGGTTYESEKAMNIEQGSAAIIAEVAPAEGLGPGDVEGHASDGMEKFTAYGEALEKEANEGEGGKKRQALVEVGLAVGMRNLIPIDVEKKSQKRQPS
ncbi:hypothetical protein BDK51DRAFT_30449 [Blyttiomyces helicus]|uniref:Uncharacterized protein n=1 Tax=Blyttiomyces helicus TaxID=388810 RepID=A0A4V1IRY7_9FUNG|nr:hypothetical protein BDK51DRAFT_30449 [Blyttiomyces helicus]|eukprot:RKO91697.1 hypothetical protein BDK51DRAFT_30449 [Blyttiomyces helicus]